MASLSCTPADGWDDRPEAEPPAPVFVGPEDRQALVMLPDGYYAGRPALPIVLLLGGYDWFAADLDDWIGISRYRDEFLLVMPDGLIDSEGSPTWNATDTCCDFDEAGTDDVGYLLGLVDEVRVRFATTQHVAVIGHSAGGFMGYRLACEPDSPVTTLVSMAGSSWLNAEDCDATHPIRLLQVHGSEDDVMPFDGDETAPGAEEVVDRWADRAGCDVGSWTYEEEGREYVYDGIGDETTVGRYEEGCEEPVELWEIEGSDHYPDVNAAFRLDLVRYLFPPRG